MRENPGRWFLASTRKVAAHTLGVLINKSLGRPLLEFEGWVTV
ncbi:hypothetical protein ACCUM_1919 [Candidatus Accumulibacter phosphatis]|uniref:Uncharacterized protein n=1 Tax=Candidatus Accumulibacter phosphatis TaxID=327160 RepID=A0A5S4EGI4_9PROT|nr:hypothetical protein ACCUM_1919 [Candidatus Accumulibacter phosphatis]